mgnify:CR=1 FL=1
MNCFLFAAEFVCGAKQIGIRVFSWNRVQKISNISFIKKTNSVAPSLYSSFFFPLLFLFLSTNIFLFASQFYGNSFVDFGTCCYTYNPSIVAVAKSSIAAVLFSPISKRFICLFSCFLIKQHPIPEIFTAHFFRNRFLALPVCPLLWN